MINANLPKAEKNTALIGFFSAMFAGLFAHGFAITNILNNYDSIYERNNPIGLGTGIYSGRWALQLLKELLRWCNLDYNLPMLNGLLFLVLIAISSGLVVSIFQLSNKKFAAYFGMLFAVFPPVTSAMFFPYTIVPYGISILFSILAVWILQKSKFLFPLAAFLIAWSMGIYQAYVTITISIFVLLLIQESFRDHTHFFAILKNGLFYCAEIILGTILYFCLLKIFLNIYNAKLSNYQGINNMGNMALEDIPDLIIRSCKSFFLFPFTNYCGLSHTLLLAIIYALLCVITLTLIALLLKNIRQTNIAFIAILLLLLLPIAINFIVFICPDGNIYTIMVYSFVFVPCTPLILFEQLSLKRDFFHSIWHTLLSKFLAVLITLLIFLNIYYANVNYTALHYTNRQINNYVTSIITQVRMTPGFRTDKKWALIGDMKDPLFYSEWELGSTYGGNFIPQNFLSTYSSRNWFTQYAGYHYPEASKEELIELSQNSIVNNMPCWPDNGSIRIIDDYVIIKFEDSN